MSRDTDSCSRFRPPPHLGLQLEDGREVSKEAFEWVAGETRDAPMLILEASKAAPYVLFLEGSIPLSLQSTLILPCSRAF